MKPANSLFRTVGSIGSATAVSRVLGLVRDMVQSFYFGAGPVTDAFTAAFRVPNLLRDLFAEGAMSSAFVPTLTRERERSGARAAWRLASRLITTLVLVLGPVCLLIALAARPILELYVTGFPADKLALTVTMTRIVAPFLLLVALAAVAMGVLNTCGKFFLPSLAPAAFNVATIVAIVALVPVLRSFDIEPGLSLAIGALVGGGLQLLVQLPALHSVGFRFRPALSWRDPGLRRIAWLMLPATFGLAATQINILVDTALASIFDDGPITYLALAFRLIQLPIGLFGVALGTATLARVSRDVAREDGIALRAHLASAFRAAAILIVPAAVGLIVLREPIVQVLFEHGRFGPTDTRRMAAAVLCYALGLVAYALTKVQVPTYYALGKTRTPVLASATAVGVKIAASLLLLALLRRLGADAFLALALSTSLAAWVNFAWLARGLRRHVGRLDGFDLGATALKMLVLSLLMGLICGVGHAWFEQVFGGGGLFGAVARLGVAIGVGVGCVWLGMRAFGFPESRLLFMIRRDR